ERVARELVARVEEPARRRSAALRERIVRASRMRLLLADVRIAQRPAEVGTVAQAFRPAQTERVALLDRSGEQEVAVVRAGVEHARVDDTRREVERERVRHGELTVELDTVDL